MLPPVSYHNTPPTSKAHSNSKFIQELSFGVLWLLVFLSLGIIHIGSLQKPWFEDYFALETAFGRAINNQLIYTSGYCIPPVSLLFFIPFGLFPISGISAFLFSIGGAVAALYASFLYLVNLGFSKRHSLFCCVLITFSVPFIEGLALGQTSPWILALTLLFFMREPTSPRASGLYLAILASLHPPLILFLMVPLLRRNWRCLNWFIFSLVGVTFLTFLTFGERLFVDYHHAVTLSLAQGNLFSNSLSLIEALRIIPRLNEDTVQLLFVAFRVLTCVLFSMILYRSFKKEHVLPLTAAISLCLPPMHLFPLFQSVLVTFPALMIFSLLQKKKKFAFSLLCFFVMALQLHQSTLFMAGLGELLTQTGTIFFLFVLALEEDELCSIASSSAADFEEGAVFSLRVITGVLVIKELFRLWSRTFGMTRFFDLDSFVYFGVGKAIRNGIRLYSDFYDSKPPGLEYIAALCSGADPTTSCSHVQSFLIFIVLGVVLVAAFFLDRRQTGIRKTCFWPVIVSLMGMQICFYLASFSIGFQTEALGALPVFLYAFLLYFKKFNAAFLRIMLLGLCIFSACFIKESYLFLIAAIFAWFCESFEDLLFSFLLPLTAAACFGFLFLWSTGNLEGFFSIYLREGFQVLIWRGTSTPLYLRGYPIVTLVKKLTTYSRVFAFNIAILVLASFVSVVNRSMAKKKKIVKLLLMTSAFYFARTGVALSSTFWSHYYALLAPLFFAITLTGSEFLAGLLPRASRWQVALSSLLIFGLLLFASIESPPLQKDFVEVSAIKGNARILDNLMAACGWDRYGFIGGIAEQPYAYTQHSPIGPIFYQIWDSQPDELYQAWFKNLDEASLIVVEEHSTGGVPGLSGNLKNREQVREMLKDHFSSEVPRCAKEFQFVFKGYTILYRTQGLVKSSGLHS